MEQEHGPLHGLRVIEMAGLGPGPFCGMLLADMGADVIVIERPAALRVVQAGDAMNRGKRSICLDLKQPEALAAVRQLIDGADALIEGYRPGVMERLGLGPSSFEASNPKLVYGRVTGWGQTGPLSQAAGHDINYVALSGAMAVSTRPGTAPSLPVTLIGDMGGGAMFLAFGIVCAMLEARNSGRGQVVDAAIVDGVGMLTALIRSMRGVGIWNDDPARNLFLHQSPFYDAFECADGKHVTLGAIEPQFYNELLQRLDLEDVDPAGQHDWRQWPVLRQRVAARIKSRTRDEWQRLLEGTDVCFAPVLTLQEAAEHEHQRARGNFVAVDGHLQPAPAPRFSRSVLREPQPGPKPGADTEAILAELRIEQTRRS
ncbi:CaiB/BaiF CoA-transferase family protein [Paucibacter sp. R3-3]|uniref:CaiB/BaiF CoA-transferase family protein n=1 Tax=Roseateles agri TaxID=3098619 RepID=A0ABU5DJQ1_9BURK|nr:CaiB/BaiF CoA-transferase family protein [Paucibacter sp. R3-3]MDY0746525.1 CaiB/BaiF CoA-transferase family protein [Paucibacter sp. R3-3]